MSAVAFWLVLLAAAAQIVEGDFEAASGLLGASLVLREISR